MNLGHVKTPQSLAYRHAGRPARVCCRRAGRRRSLSFRLRRSPWLAGLPNDGLGRLALVGVRGSGGPVVGEGIGAFTRCSPADSGFHRPVVAAVGRHHPGAVGLHASDQDLVDTHHWEGCRPGEAEAVPCHVLGRLHLCGEAGERPSPVVPFRSPSNTTRLPPTTIPRIFDRFYKADTARARSDGSGLGLAIAWENVRLHGGQIHAGTHPDGGAVFLVSLPLNVPGSR
jgi:hypothetical protein